LFKAFLKRNLAPSFPELCSGTFTLDQKIDRLVNIIVRVQQMPEESTANKRVSPAILREDGSTLEGLQTIPEYSPQRTEASVPFLESAQTEMIRLQKVEMQLKAQHKEALDAARQAEWKFHNGVQEAKTSVVAQFGPNSTQVGKVGRKKKSAYNRPGRKKKK
jgi:hypothetical protein